jgi:long-chain acyl-CoA synthetase
MTELAATLPWAAAYPDDVEWAAELPRTPLPAILADSTARFAERTCLHFLGRSWTYGAVSDLVARVASGLKGMGVGPGVPVGLFLPNVPFHPVCYFAVLRLGGVVVNLNPLMAEEEIARQVDDAGLRVLITLDLGLLYDKAAAMLEQGRLDRLVICRFAGALPPHKGFLFRLVRGGTIRRPPADARFVDFAALARTAPGEPGPGPAADDLAVLQYTGGTTGTPKAAELTHANIAANVAQTIRWLPGVEPGREVVLAVLPFVHVFGMTVVMNVALALGAELVLLPRFDLGQAMRTIHARRVTAFPAVPSILGAILDHRDREKFDLTSLKIAFSGGAPLPVEVKTRFETLTGCRVVEGYGLTEAGPLVAANPLNGPDRPGSIGLPVPGTRIEIVSLDDLSRTLPPGERGEICVRGPQVMRGYWRRPEETAAVLRDGRLRTGDVGLMDTDGYTWLVDRLKDLVLVGGYNVYPRMVEEAVYRHPAVAECVAAGVPDPHRGQVVKLWASLRPGASLTLEELNVFLGDKLSPMEQPKRLEIREALPKTPIGKLSRKDLLDEEGARPD